MVTKPVNIPIPSVPSDASPELRVFLSRVKEIIEVREGLRGDSNRFFTLSELSTLMQMGDDDTATDANTPFNNTTPINPPSAMSVVVEAFSHVIKWTNCTDEHLAGVEIWSNTVNSVTEATRVAVVGRQTDSYTHNSAIITVDLYYWIRSISYSGSYSPWVPTEEQGGYLVAREESLGERIEKVLSALMGETPDLYDPAIYYTAGEYVRWEDTDDIVKRYKRTLYTLGTKGVTPANSLYWERVGILVQGDVDGQPTVGIDGHLVVDQTILARSIQTSGLVVGDGSNGTIQMQNGTITVAHVNSGSAAALLNANQLWTQIAGTGKPENNATNDALFRHPSDVTKINGGKIFTGSIVASAITVASLSALSANLGTITAGLARSSDSRLQVDFNNKWIRVYDTNSVLRVQLGYIP